MQTMTRRQRRLVELAERAEHDTYCGYVCKQCDAPTAFGVGYAVYRDRDAFLASAAVTATRQGCPCGASGAGHVTLAA